MPDSHNVVAVEGRGPAATNDYTATALAADGSFAIASRARHRDGASADRCI